MMRRNGHQIRAAYLSKLGIFPPGHPSASSSNAPQRHQQQQPPVVVDKPKKRRLPSEDSQSTMTTQESSTCSSVATLSSNDRSFSSDSGSSTAATICDYEEPLIFDEEEEVYCFHHNLNTPEVVVRKPSQPQQSHRTVHFHQSVAVVNIPSYRDLSKTDRRSIWNSIRVLDQNAKRNALEFFFDGNDWRSATEEGDFIQTRKGKLLHPATWRAIHNDNMMNNRPRVQQGSPRGGTRRAYHKSHNHTLIPSYSNNQGAVNPRMAALTRFADT